MKKEHGLNWYYFGAHYYDPAIGRWLEHSGSLDLSGLSVDPLANDYPSWAPYNYVLDSPLNLIDKKGMSADSWDIGGDPYVYYSGIFANDEDLPNCGETETIEVTAERPENKSNNNYAGAALLVVGNLAAWDPEPITKVTITGLAVITIVYINYVNYKNVVNRNLYKKSKSADDTDSKIEKSDSKVKANSKVWKKLKPFRGKTKTNGKSGKKREYYEWDQTHNEIEVYDHTGKHKGAIDPNTGKYIKPPVPGRRINL